MDSSSTDEEKINEDFVLDKDGYLDFGPHDSRDPKNWSTARKCYITATAITLVINATFASSAPSANIVGISRDLHISQEAANLVTTMFLLGYCAGPLVWAPLSEFYGRRWIFHITFMGYLAFNFLCAFTPNFAGLLLGRFLSSFFVSAALSNSPGVLSDVWDVNGRGQAMILFSVATFIGPALGPVAAGFLELKENWRWTFYMLLWLAGVTEVLLLGLPETLSSTILLRMAQQIRKQNSNSKVQAPSEGSDRSLLAIYNMSLKRPWILLFDTISLLIAIYYALVYTLLYMLFSIYPIVFQQKRGWNAGVGELPLLGVVTGAILGGLFLFGITLQAKKKQNSTPEDRLPAAMIGGVLFAFTMFWFAWTAEFNFVHWIVPTLAGTFLSMSILLIFVSYINYLIDSYSAFAASAVAANTVVRSACAAAEPLFTQYMFDALGVGGGGSLIAGLAVLCAPIPFLFYRYGRTIRERSKFASA